PAGWPAVASGCLGSCIPGRVRRASFWPPWPRWRTGLPVLQGWWVSVAVALGVFDGVAVVLGDECVHGASVLDAHFLDQRAQVVVAVDLDADVLVAVHAIQGLKQFSHFRPPAGCGFGLLPPRYTSILPDL